MDRPKTGTPGRRRLRTGSVRVTELTGGRRVRIPEPSTSPEQDGRREHARPRPSVIDGPDALRGQGTARAADEQATVEFERVAAGQGSADQGSPDRAGADNTTDTFAAVPADRPPARSRTYRVAQAAGLGLAVATLCGAVATAAVVTRDRAANAADSRPSLQVTGERALLPDRLAEAYADSGRWARIVPPADPTQANHRQAPRDARARDSTSPAHSLPAARPLLTASDVVLEFYRLATDDPAAAYDLVAADALGTSEDEFDAAFEVVRDVRVVSVDRAGAPGEVLAVVLLTLDDGSHLRVRQLLTVTGVAPQRISDAELLAVQSE